MNNTYRFNKKGTSTIFLSIILSVVVLIECTFMAYLWNLSRALEINRALKVQIESVFACYDRQLFDVYGIYAFSLDEFDQEIYKKCLEENGLKDGEDIYIQHTRTINTDCIKKAIADYYLYRGSGIAVKAYGDLLINLIKSVDKYEIIPKIKEFTSSEASNYLAEILSGTSKIMALIEKASQYIDLSEYSEGIETLIDLSKLARDSKNDLKKYKNNFDITDLSFATEAINGIYDFTDKGSEFIANYGLHVFAAHYASYNFDCAVSNDCDQTLNNTNFSDIHSENYFDAEYILTGLDGRLGFLEVSALIFQIIFVKKFLDIMGNPALMAMVKVAAELICSVVTVLSDGAIPLPETIWELVIVLIIAACKAGTGVSEVLNGAPVEIFETKEVGVISLNYRDFLFLYMNCVNTDNMLYRMREVLKRDYGDMFYGATFITKYNGREYKIYKDYSLYL